MNKLMITIGLLSSMTIAKPNEIKRDGTNVYHGTQLVWAMDNLEDMKEWIGEDVNNSRMSEEIAENYYELLEETESFIQDFYEKQCR
jgi:hypothetical protein